MASSPLPWCAALFLCRWCGCASSTKPGRRARSTVSPTQETMEFSSSLLRPPVIGEWIGREENDADPLAAGILQPPVSRSKNDQWESEDSGSSPAGRCWGRILKL
ncbi:uncharacterized protein C8orf34-like [Callospermophilus lateralis]|uniref:uncharacterized protein C8orf34-like n=1 Tax=Callospermophilus lateralis TaxID=76772 RepID=UPI0040385447